MEIKKHGRKWFIEGGQEGWVFNRAFPTKWKAQIALEVFNQGGRVSHYYQKAREKRPEKVVPWRALKKVKKMLKQIEVLNPTCEEIEEYVDKKYADASHYGVVTVSNGDDYFGPFLHDTWGEKRGGRVHIDIGCCGYHLMLDQYRSEDFVQFIKSKREMKSPGEVTIKPQYPVNS